MIELKTTAIKQEKLLYAVLKTTKIELDHIIQNKKSYYRSYDKIKKDKRDKIVYENGQPKKRNINYTSGRLNDLQTAIARKILAKIPLPSNVKGSVKGSSNIANAKAHLGKHYKFKTDIKKYFPSISQERVLNMFIQNGFSSRVASLLTHITTHNYELPQGTPTSSAIANLVFVPNDIKLNGFSLTNQLTHTRYVDDLVFSSHFDFKDKISDIIQFILDDGFSISVKKTIYTSGSLEITGILTKQNVLDATDEYKELVTDLTIDPTKTEARKKYIKRIKATRKASSRKTGTSNNGV
jgi:RNA-directed DNA polymerase